MEKYTLTDFVSELNTALTLIDPTRTQMPLPPLQEGDQEVWMLTEELQKLFVYSMLLSKEAANKKVDVLYTYSANNPEGEVKNAEVTELLQKSAVLRELLWYLVQTNIGGWGEDFGVREGFIIVKRKEVK